MVRRHLVDSVAAVNNVLTFIGEVQTRIYSVAEIYPNLLTLLFHLLQTYGISCHSKCNINFDKFINSLHRESGTVLNNANKKHSLRFS